MTTLSEGDLRLILPEQVTARKFDVPEHGLSHCRFKSVDWILELPEQIYFIEVKDPQGPRDKDLEDPGTKKREQNSKYFLESFLADKLNPDLVAKFRDSFLYEWACERVDKPISYFVIFAWQDLDRAQLLTRSDTLKRRLPTGTPAGWSRPIAHDCIVFNIAAWNKAFPQYPLSRHSAAGRQVS